ncbi:hypothetical protein C0J52_26467, partial [Blattella germanica]
KRQSVPNILKFKPVFNEITPGDSRSEAPANKKFKIYFLIKNPSGVSNPPPFILYTHAFTA